MTVSQREDDWMLSPDKEPEQNSAPKTAIIQRQKPPSSNVQASVSDIKDYIRARSKKKLTKINVVSPMSEVFISTKNKERWGKLRQHIQNLDLNRQ